MKKVSPLFFFFFLSLSITMVSQNTDSIAIRKLYDYHLTQSKTYENLRVLCKSVGHRLSGSPQAAKAVDWAKQALMAAGADTVFLVPCKVPHWVRGAKEKCQSSDGKTQFSVRALGGSVGTEKGGIKAEVIECENYAALEKLDNSLTKGKIIFFNYEMNPKLIHCGEAYGDAVDYRWGAANAAAKKGAVAVLVRSVTHSHNDYPHTGSMAYDQNIAMKIPACALSVKSAEELSRQLKKNPRLSLFLETHCQQLPDEDSYSVVGEIRGSEFPDNVILAGGHLDSWDLGEGAHDDGAGIVQSIEIIAGFKNCGIRPRHTVQVVCFMNEENGTRGAKSFLELAKTSGKKYKIAIESDAGGFDPKGITIDAGKDTLHFFQAWNKVLEPYTLHIQAGHGGVDISPLKKVGCICTGLNPDSQRYFDYHHTDEDVFETVHPRELQLGSAAMNAFLFLADKYGTP